ncbi:MAG: L-threonylcarbamoyladenylate synthase [Deltaproteobacteria bacterium]|nr:L-threonylcarbamoyladenylate synthase [Deltaproteobacteria bacterium]
MQSVTSIAAALKDGGVAVVPTESSYALAARVASDAVSYAACARIAALKGRPDGKAFPVVATAAQMADVVDPAWVPRLLRLVDLAVWPGPLTVAVRARPGLPTHVADCGRIAIRIPRDETLIALCTAVGSPLTATSANRAGDPPTVDPLQAAIVFPDLPILDRGVLKGGAPSTIVSVSDAFAVTLVREGAIPWSRARTIEEVLRG